MHKIQNIDKKFPAFSRDCWIILCFKLLNLGVPLRLVAASKPPVEGALWKLKAIRGK